MVFEILDTATNNYVNIIPYLAYQGLEYQLSDVDDVDAGRNMAGTMMRGKITDKDKFKFKFKTLKTSEVSMILQLITKEYLTCRYTSPRYNSIVVKTMYPGDRTAQYAQYKDGETTWMGLAVDLIER